MMIRWKVAFLGMAIGSSVLLLDGYQPGPAIATHEADHRFIVFGYVRDDQGRPLSGQRVIVVDTRLDQGNTTFTDRDGYYEALLHLHNEDVGDEIAVMVGDQRKTIRAQFNPDDHRTERRNQVDFGASPAAGAGPGFERRWPYGLAIAVVAGALLAMGLLRYQKRSRAQAPKKMK